MFLESSLRKQNKMNVDKLIKVSIRGFTAVSIFIGLGVFPLSFSNDEGIIITNNKAAATSGGGPIVLDGMDPVCHSGYESTGQYIARVLKKVHDGSSNPSNGHIAVLGSNGGMNSCGAAWVTKLTEYTSEFSSAPIFDFYTTDAQISAFFDTTINSAQPAVLWIPDNWSRSASKETLFTVNAEKIADFVNSGGGLFANNGTYGWLTALLPTAVYNGGGCNGGPEATTDGVSDFNLTNTIVAACWHGYFTGSVGTLKTLVDYPYPTASSTRKSVSIGGGSVSLPSSFTIAVSPSSPNAGEDITITATAQTISGVPQTGVTVTISVSTGPDAGSIFSAITDSSGIATIVIRTSATGTAVYTATATVNGVSKTVSATVLWNPPTSTTSTSTTSTTTTSTTLAPIIPETSTPVESTTSTVETTLPLVVEQTPSTVANIPALITPDVKTEQTTTTSIAMTATSAVPEEASIGQTPTTVAHDHSSHSHGVTGTLPKTGSGIIYRILLSLYIVGVGFFFLSYVKRKQ